ncbi:MAG: hypothetical protein KBC91_00480 [Candidatus Omnitrophica bacterium]|nr:hypothetical protein [Candidatus Omnitrophota bacterium]
MLRKVQPAGLRINILLMVASLFLGLLTCEIVARQFLPAYNPEGAFKGFQVTKNEGLLLGIPNTTSRDFRQGNDDFNVVVHINQDGFRDSKDLRTAKDTDWFLVGDSFAFGSGIPEGLRFGDLIEKRWHVPVYNLALPGADFRIYKRYLGYARNKSGITPRNLIVMVCMQNDIKLYSVEKNIAFEPGLLGWIKRGLARHSALYNVSANFLHSRAALERFAKRMRLVKEKTPRHPENILGTNAIADSVSLLVEIAKRSENSFIVLVPAKNYWSGKYQDYTREVHSLFVSALAVSGVRFIDLKGAFETGGGSPLDYYFKVDSHMNLKGQIKAADYVDAILSQAAKTR